MQAAKILAFIAFSVELAFCLRFMNATKLAYAPGEGVLVVGIVPTLLILSSAYQLAKIFKGLSKLGTEEKTPGIVPVVCVFGMLLGGIGVAFGSYTGPHGGPGLVAFGLVAQWLAFTLARRMCMHPSSPKSGA